MGANLETDWFWAFLARMAREWTYFWTSTNTHTIWLKRLNLSQKHIRNRRRRVFGCQLQAPVGRGPWSLGPFFSLLPNSVSYCLKQSHRFWHGMGGEGFQDVNHTSA